ncbi:hypothetical protein [Pseudomonas sp. SWRI154]|uniref:hypothetical protein n=1 Tax=Pseudomonas sp. SWRI154 TaxID=2745501 RepID=UPI001645B961|nr:hypothetical protein [Pseudomonas sp. SWRI154]MBC3365985.1 hypothetical protein [Pseudomonas sp. SWRI154]
MKYKIMGVIEGDDFASYEKTLCIDNQDLAKIMGWVKKEESLYDYELTAVQVDALEEACSIELPRKLLLYLTTSSEQ